MEKVEVSSIKYPVSGQEPGYKKLHAWQAADDFAMTVYSATKHFPQHEIFGLTSQVRRVALAVPTNIVEGQASSSKKDFRRFLFIANTSLVEAEYLLSVATKLGYLDNTIHIALAEKQSLIAKLLQGLIRSIKHDT